MGRKAIHLTMKHGKSHGRQAMWEAIRASKKGFTIGSIALNAEAERGVTRVYVLSLFNGGFIEDTGQKKAHPRNFAQKRKPEVIYTLAKDVGVEAPRLRKDGTPCERGAAREQMWRTVKRIAPFTTRELASLASTTAHTVTEVDAKDYCNHLRKAGYLRVAAASGPNQQAKLAFVRGRDTGPRPPVVQRYRRVFDLNIREVVWEEEAGNGD